VPFARDRLVEAFFYASGIVPESHNADCREILCKLAVLIVIVDDVYDIYATFDELLLFNEAIKRYLNERIQCTSLHVELNIL
jgi:Terpene synthase family, metal binding domain